MEKTLAEPLSGKEVVIAIADMAQQAILDALGRDCYLTKELAYPQFGGTVTIRCWVGGPQGRVPIERDVTFGEKQPEDVQVHGVNAEVQLDDSSPNATRVETGQPVPTLTKDDNGRPVVKGVTYSRRKKTA